MQSTLNPRLVLASTSAYKKSLLRKLRTPFISVDPGYKEVVQTGETPLDAAVRLALGKAEMAYKNLQKNPEWDLSAVVIIGCDQIAHLNGEILHKPGDHRHAVDQLAKCSGQWVSFRTAIALLYHDKHYDKNHDNQHHGVQCKQASEVFEIHYRQLTARVIDDYVEKDKPFDCAGSIKFESHGVRLVDNSRGRDINTLLGFPLMLVQDLLESIDYSL